MVIVHRARLEACARSPRDTKPASGSLFFQSFETFACQEFDSLFTLTLDTRKCTAANFFPTRIIVSEISLIAQS